MEPPSLVTRPRTVTDRRRKELKVDWSKIQSPGYSADYLDRTYERRDLAYGREDWDATPAAEAYDNAVAEIERLVSVGLPFKPETMQSSVK